MPTDTRGMPHARQVCDQSRDALLHLRRDARRLVASGPRVGVFGLRQLLQTLVPLPLQRVRHQPMLRPHQEKLLLGELGLFARPLDVRARGAIEVDVSGVQLLKDLDGDVDGRWGEGLEHTRADRGIRGGARNLLADGVAVSMPRRWHV